MGSIKDKVLCNRNGLRINNPSPAVLKDKEDQCNNNILVGKRPAKKLIKLIYLF